MYTRTYAPTEEQITVPSGYDGTAFENEIEEVKEALANEPISEEKSEEVGLFGRIPFLKGFPIFEGIKLPTSLAGEDLVLLGLALLLFFTKDGDRECALMIALLLFIK